uniref:COesterase domain-containing protein n=1 Tax=Macrostomum lignano TaxID=282301 RepID=A0A1I8HCU1_9PLAT
MANNYEPDDGGFSGRYGNGRHQRQLQQKQNKQVATQRFSYADPMSDGTLRGIANPDYQRRPQDLPVFTVSGPKVAFNSEPPGESSTDAIGSYWLDQQDNQTSGFLSSRPRLILAAIILLLIALAVILVITLPTVLVSNRQYQQSLQAAAAARNADNRRREASGTRRETACGVLTATSVTGSSAMVYRFTGIPYALRPNGTRLLLPAQPIDSQTACREVWAMTSEEANTAWHQRRLRYPHSADAVPMCLQYAGIGDSPTAGLEGSTDCLYLDLATPAEKPGANLPTV